MLLSVDTHCSGCGRFVPPAERRDLVVRPLELLGHHLALAVERHAVDELDVGRPAPRRHQPIGRGAAVLVGEDHRIAELPARRNRDDLVPHEHRHVRELADGVRPRVDDGRHRLRHEVVSRRRDDDDVDLRDGRGPGLRRRQRRIGLDPQSVLAHGDRAERDVIVRVLRAPREQQVLRVLPVDQDPDRGRFPPLDAPVARAARGVDRRPRPRRLPAP